MTSPGPKMLSPLPLYLSEWALPSCLADHGASLEAGDQRFPDEKELSDSDGAPPSARAQGPRMGKDLFFAVAPGPDLASSKDLVGRPAHWEVFAALVELPLASTGPLTKYSSPPMS
jgi:hypothetical protein